MPSNSSNDRITLVDEMKQEEGNRWGCVLITIIICCVILPITINSNTSTKNTPIHKKHHSPTSQPSSQPSSQPTSNLSFQPTFQPSLLPTYNISNSSIINILLDMIFNNNSYLRYN